MYLNFDNALDSGAMLKSRVGLYRDKPAHWPAPRKLTLAEAHARRVLIPMIGACTPGSMALPAVSWVADRLRSEPCHE